MSGLRIYDVAADGYRDATQLDIDRLGAVSAAYGRVRDFVAQEHSRLAAELKAMDSRAGKAMGAGDE